MSPVVRAGNHPLEVIGVRVFCCIPADIPSVDPSTVLVPEVNEICFTGNGKDPKTGVKVTSKVDMIE